MKHIIYQHHDNQKCFLNADLEDNLGSGFYHPCLKGIMFQEFNDFEQRRALNARRSKFNLKKASDTQGINTALQEFSKPATLPTPWGSKSIEAEKARVLAEIEKLNSGPRSSSGVPALAQGLTNLPTEKPKDNHLKEITVGQPASRGGPKPGQKLLPTATVINGVLDQTLMSDYAGSYRGMITHDVYDVTNTSIIFPKGSRFTGDCLRISNVNEPIQARMGLTVKWIILPNGKRIDLRTKGDMLDREGIHAVKDKVNRHFIAQFLGVAAYALLSSETSREGSGISNDRTYEGEVGEAMRKQFAPVAAKYLNLVPTITLRNGTPVKIFIEDDVYADEWQSLRKSLMQAHRASY